MGNTENNTKIYPKKQLLENYLCKTIFKKNFILFIFSEEKVHEKKCPCILPFSFLFFFFFKQQFRMMVMEQAVFYG